MKRSMAALFAIGLVFNPVSSLAVIDIYLCITDRGFTGESSTSGFEGCSRVQDVLEAAQASSGPGRIAQPKPFRISQRVNTMSQALATAMVLNSQIREAILKVRRPGIIGADLPTLEIRLLNSRITEYSVTSNVEDPQLAYEQFALVPETVEWTYRRLDISGSVVETITQCWDIVANGILQSCP